MKSLLPLVFLLIIFGTARAQVPEGQHVWAFPANSLLAPGGLQASSVPDHVKVEREPQTDPNNDLSAPLKISYDGTGVLQLRIIESLPFVTAEISTHHYAITGEVRHENVSAGSYLEMWSHFASPAPGYPEAAYFSRTLGENGPMGKLEGTHDWREFQLPFDATGTKTKLVQLEMNLHLSGPGTVHIRNMMLVQYADASASTASSTTDAIPGVQVIADLPIEKYLSSDQDQKDLLENFHYDKVAPKGEFQITYPKEADGTTGILIARPGTDMEPYRIALLTVPKEVVSQLGSCYGIMGEVSYSDVKNGVLVMASCFSRTGLSAPLDFWLPGQEGSKWGGKSDAMGHIQGTREWGNFYLGFNRGHSTFSFQNELKRIGFSLLLEGPGTVHLRNLKLVQYPEPPPEPKAQISPTPPATSGAINTTGIDWKSFLLGVAATGASLLAGGGIIFISRRWNRRRHERELRRIASLDS